MEMFKLRSDDCGLREKWCGRLAYSPLGQTKNISEVFSDEIYKTDPETRCLLESRSGSS